ncbi:MAG: hypothetical protein ACYDAO_05860 [Thermoplasmataceae archaeon]
MENLNISSLEDITIKVVKYAQKNSENIDSYFKSLKSTNNNFQKFFLFADLDCERFQCISSRKDGLRDKFMYIRDNDIIIVKREIESWYISGLSKEDCKTLKIKYPANPELISKEKFKAMLPKGISDSEFRKLIMEKFSIELARIRSPSFNYFISKFLSSNATCDGT